MATKLCSGEHDDLCNECSKPTKEKCPVHNKCKCSSNSKIISRELIVGYRFESIADGKGYSPPFKGASGGTVIVTVMPIAGPIWKYKERNKWVVECCGCSENKSTMIDHSWLLKWAYKHRCKTRVDMPR